MLSPSTVFHQQAQENELDVMFRVGQLSPVEVWEKRQAVLQLQQAMNQRCVQLLLGWLQKRGLQPDVEGEVVSQDAGAEV